MPAQSNKAWQAAYLGIPVAEWVGTLQGGDPLERRLAAHALGEIGPRAREAVPALRAALEDPTDYVRVWAAAALARIDRSRGESLAALIAGTKEERPFVRSLAAWHLGRLGPEFPGIEQSIPAVRMLLEDENHAASMEAAVALRNLEGRGAPPLELWSLSRA
jgi:HEAT repeat protein